VRRPPASLPGDGAAEVKELSPAMRDWVENCLVPLMVKKYLALAMAPKQSPLGSLERGAQK
jgi:hypothetical protein